MSLVENYSCVSIIIWGSGFSFQKPIKKKEGIELRFEWLRLESHELHSVSC